MPIDLTEEEYEALARAWIAGRKPPRYWSAALAVIYAAPLSVLERVVERRKAEKEAGE